MGPSHVRFELQNHQNQCSIQASPTNRLRKKLKFWQNIPWRTRSPSRKRCTILSSDEGDMINTSPSAPNSDMLQWTLAELKLWGPVELVDKKNWNFDRIFLEEQGVHKKIDTRFQVWMREIWSKQAQVLRIQTCSNELWLNWNFGDWLSRLRKNLKFWYNIPWRTRSPLKKWCAIPSTDEGDMIETSPSAPYSNLLLWTPIELKFWGDVTFFL